MASDKRRPVVLITGNAGFTGRHLVEYLRRPAMGPEPLIFGLDVRAGEARGVDEQFCTDVSDGASVSACVSACNPDFVIHLAGRMPPAPDEALWAVNVGAALHLFEALRALRCPPRVLVIGSAAEYGPAGATPLTEGHVCRPATTYGRTKFAQTLLAQRYCAEFGLPVVVARPFNLFGPGMLAQTVIGEVCHQLSSPDHRRPLRLGNLNSARDFLDVRDAAAAYWTLVQWGAPGEVYNICSGRATRIGDVVALLQEYAGDPRRVEIDPQRLRDDDVGCSCGDGSKLQKLLGRPPCRDLRESLRDTLAPVCHCSQAVDVDGSTA